MDVLDAGDGDRSTKCLAINVTSAHPDLALSLLSEMEGVYRTPMSVQGYWFVGWVRREAP
jgi:hypothetical protein